MIYLNGTIRLFDASYTSNSLGEKVYTITNDFKTRASITNPSINLYKSGVTQKFNLVIAVTVQTNAYKRQQFLQYKNEIYRIESLTNSKDLSKMVLNCSDAKDGGLSEALANA